MEEEPDAVETGLRDKIFGGAGGPPSPALTPGFGPRSLLWGLLLAPPGPPPRGGLACCSFFSGDAATVEAAEDDAESAVGVAGGDEICVAGMEPSAFALSVLSFFASPSRRRVPVPPTLARAASNMRGFAACFLRSGLTAGVIGASDTVVFLVEAVESATDISGFAAVDGVGLGDAEVIEGEEVDAVALE